MGYEGAPWNVAYIGLGSNLGEKIHNCTEAIGRLQAHPQCEVLRLSSFYETEPITKRKNQTGGWFVNGVVKIKTRLGAVKLLQLLLDIEAQLGRPLQHEKWSPRIIDLDLLFFNDEIIKTGPLRVPHPELHKRRFVLEPLAEIAPEFVHPVKGKTIETLLQHLTENKKIIPLFRFYLMHHVSESFGQG